ncbi:MAG TPA: PAS domain-containing protein [Desulfobacteria bacterium]|nr:PAS domain-containing protein [Desulfobacteria bacterium]
MDGIYITALRTLPSGVILFDKEDSVVFWNNKAEIFLKDVNRPSLKLGGDLLEFHPESSHQGVKAMLQAIKNGKKFPAKLLKGASSSFQVSYIGLFSSETEYVGIMQLIDFK